MLLAFGSCICNQGVGVEPPGLPKDGAGDVDRIVRSKLLDDVARRVVAGRKLVCEPYARGDFDVFSKPSDDFAESPDLFFGIPAGNQNVARVPQSLQTAFGGSSGYRIFQIRQKRFWFSHPINSILR